MMIYHGSNVEIDQPKIIQSNRALDFGFGFYTTTFKSKSPYDITIGEVADEQVFDTINLLSRGWIDVEVATQRLKFKLPNNQVCINNQEVIEKCLKYVGMEVVK